MKTVASLSFLLLLVTSMNGQILVDSLEFPVPPWRVEVPAAGEIFMIPYGKDTLCHSIDNGRNWTVAVVPRTSRRDQVTYTLSSQQGGKALLAFNESNTTRDTQFVSILVTLDAGATWTVERFIVTERLPLPMLADLRYYTLCDDSTLFLRSGTEMYRSTDKGKSWNEVPELSGMQGLRFIRSEFGCARKTIGDSSIVVSTTDGGASWRSDTLAWRVGGMELLYDGSILANPYGEGTPLFQYFKKDQDAPWERILWPAGGEIEALDFTWDRMVYLGGDTFLAIAYDNSFVGYVFVTLDRGASWTRVQFIKATLETKWRTLDMYWREAWRTDDNRLLARQSYSPSIVDLQVPRQHTMLASAEDFSSTTRVKTLLRWSDPFTGHAVHADIDRCSSDSNWTRIAQGPLREQQFLDSTFQDGRTLRYRVVLHADDSSGASAISDSITPMLGAYVDLLDYLIPGEDKLLRYGVVKISGINPRFFDTVYYNLSLHFLPVEDSTDNIRLHPVRLIRRNGAGSEDTTFGRIIEHRDLYHHFIDEQVYTGLAFDLVLPGDPTYHSNGPKHPGIIRADLVDPFGRDLPDSLLILMNNPGSMLYSSANRITAVRGIGVSHLFALTESSMTHSFMSVEWQLIEHVNSADDPPLPTTSLSLSSYPNPVTANATVRFSLPQSGEITLAVYDMLGRQVANLADGQYLAGRHVATFNSSSLLPGIYLILLRQGGLTIIEKLVLL
jgi:photosystem II stability/assembly factor-like uncharacterized protein